MSETALSRDPARVVLITGEPGSGKTTLGTELSRAMRIPFIARDDVRAGLFFTAGAWSARPGHVPPSDQAVEAFLRIVETTAGLGVSCVVEYAVRKRRPEDLQRIAAVADCLVLYTWCGDSLERLARRSSADRLLNRQPVLDALGYATIGEHTRDAIKRAQSAAGEMRTDFDLPILRVNTDQGYDPGIDSIIDFAMSARSAR